MSNNTNNTSEKPLEKQIHYDDYKILSDVTQALYKKQWQRWNSGWVDANELQYEIRGSVRVVYRLLTEYPEPVSKPLSTSVEEMAEKSSNDLGLLLGAAYHHKKGFIAGYTANNDLDKVIELLQSERFKFNENQDFQMSVYIGDLLTQIQQLKNK